MERLIIDTDPGVDDAHALMMAYAHPAARVEAISVVAGNVGLDRTVANAAIILDALGAETPVYAGCSRALVEAPVTDAAYVHGTDGLGDAGLPPSRRKIEEEHAALMLVRKANEEPGEFTLVCIGPLTNLATALALDPDLPRKYKKLVVMGGAIYARGNTHHIAAEFNMYADPEAAKAVISRWPDLILASWETTIQHTFDAETSARWMKMDTPKGRFFQQITANLVVFVKAHFDRDTLFAADGLAMAVALEPDIVTQAEEHAVFVETNGQHTRGQTVIDWGDRTESPHKATIVLEVDQARFSQLFENGLK